jgi:hypothetical protein
MVINKIDEDALMIENQLQKSVVSKVNFASENQLLETEINYLKQKRKSLEMKKQTIQSPPAIKTLTSILQNSRTPKNPSKVSTTIEEGIVEDLYNKLINLHLRTETAQQKVENLEEINNSIKRTRVNEYEVKMEKAAELQHSLTELQNVFYHINQEYENIQILHDKLDFITADISSIKKRREKNPILLSKKKLLSVSQSETLVSLNRHKELLDKRESTNQTRKTTLKNRKSTLDGLLEQIKQRTSRIVETEKHTQQLLIQVQKIEEMCKLFQEEKNSKNRFRD